MRKEACLPQLAASGGGCQCVGGQSEGVPDGLLAVGERLNGLAMLLSPRRRRVRLALAGPTMATHLNVARCWAWQSDSLTLFSCQSEVH